MSATPRIDPSLAAGPPALVGSGVELDVAALAQTMPSPTPAPVSTEVLVTVDRQLDVPTELVGVLDFHSPADTEDKGFAELRARAAALGADAVIDAEFEHGEDGGLSHLSGMAVRRR